MLSIASVFLLTSSWAATALGSRRLFSTKLSVAEQAAGALPLSITFTSWLALALLAVLPVSGLSSSTFIVALCCAHAAVLAVAVWASSSPSMRDTARDVRSMRTLVMPAACLVLPAVWLVVLQLTHSLHRTDEGQYQTGGTSYSDLPFHLNLINSFIHGANQGVSLVAPLTSPFYANHPLAYPFVPDFHTALLIAAGSSVQSALEIPGSLLSAAFLTLLLALNMRLTSSSRAAVLSVFLTLFAGGLGALKLLSAGLTWSNFQAADHVLRQIDGAESFWFSFVAHIWLPQRTTNVAYPTALFALLLLVKVVTRDDKAKAQDDDHHLGTPCQFSPLESFFSRVAPSEAIRFYTAAGVVTGLLPTLQPHSFVAVGIICITVAGVQTLSLLQPPVAPAVRIVRHLKNWTAFGVAAFALAAPQLLMFLSRVASSDGSFVRLRPIWISLPATLGPVGLWFRSLGLFVPLFAAAPFVLNMRTSQRLFHMGFAAVFLVSNVVIFQPWEMDNTKVLYVWMFGASGSVAAVIDWMWSNLSSSSSSLANKFAPLVSPLPSPAVAGVGSPMHTHFQHPHYNPPSIPVPVKPTSQFAPKALAMKAGVVLLVTSLVASGVLSVVKETFDSSTLYDRVDEELGNWFRAHTTKDAVVLPIVDDVGVFRPESSLAGRQLTGGFGGWLWSHGIDSAARQGDMQQIALGGPTAIDLIRKHKLTHVVVSWDSPSAWSPEFLHNVALLKADNGRYGVFEIVPDEALLARQPCHDVLSHQHDQRACMSYGCMWLPNIGHPDTKVNECFKPPTQIVSPERVDCVPPHLPGVTPETCHETLGCAWVEGFDGPWCHRHKVPEALAAPLEVITGKDGDCGWGGISRHQCERRGCLWGPPGPDAETTAWCRTEE